MHENSPGRVRRRLAIVGVNLAATCAAAILLSPPIETQPAGCPQPELAVQHSHMERALDASFSRSGMLALGDGWGTVDIWDTRSWTLVRSIGVGDPGEGRRYNTSGIALSPDGRTLAVADAAGRVGLWDVRSGSLIRDLPGAVGFPVAVAWSADDRLIAAGGETASVWDARTGQLVREFASGGDVALSSDGKLLAIAGDHDAFLFDLATGKRLRTFTDKSGVWAVVAVSPDGKLVATGGEEPDWEMDWPHDFAPTESAYAHEQKVKLWDAHTGKLLRILPGHYSLDGGTRVLQFSADSRRLFSGGSSHCAVWDVRTGRPIRHLESSYACAMSPDGRMVFTSGEYLDVHSVSTGRRLARFHPPPLRVEALAFSPDGALIASAEQFEPLATALRLWDAQTCRPVRLLHGPGTQFPRVGFLDGGGVYLSGLQGGAIWDAAAGKLTRRLEGPREMGFGGVERKWAMMTPDGSKLVTESGKPFSTTLKVWSMSTGKLVCRIPSQMGGVGSAAFSRDGRYMAAIATHRPTVYRVWSLETGDVVSELADGFDYVSPLIFSPDGRCLAGSAFRQGIVFWDRESGRQTRRIGSTAERCTALAFSNDGRTLAAVLDGSLNLYESGTGRLLGSIPACEGVTALAFSPNDRTIATGDGFGRVRLWDPRERRLIATMVGLSERDRRFASEDWYAFSPEGRYDWSDGAAPLIRWRLGGWLYPASAFESRVRGGPLTPPCAASSPDSGP